MPPSVFLPPLECCFGTNPIQAEKFRPDRNAFGSAGNGGDQSSGQHRTDAGSFIEPHAHLVGSVPGPDQPVELQDLLLDPAQLSSECQETRTGISGTRLSFGSATTLSSPSTP